MQKAFKAVPLVGLGSSKGSVVVLATTDFDALMQAKKMLGDTVPFDLSEGERLVVTYRPARVWGVVRTGTESL